MTDEEIDAAAQAALDNSLATIKTLFPTLLGQGLDKLSKDQRILIQACKTMEERLVEKNRDDNFLIDESDRKTGSYNLKNYRHELIGEK